MSGLMMGFSQKIDAWNSNEEETDGCSHNMLRILQNKIINTSRTQHVLTKHKSINLKAIPVVRPATVRVRPVSSTKAPQQIENKNFGSCNAFQLNKVSGERKFSEKIQAESNDYRYSKIRNKSVQTMKKDRSINKQNAIDKYMSENEKQRKQEVEMKKQCLIFTYNSLKNKKENNISRFHEMQVKLRNNKVRNGSSMASHRKVNIIIQRKNEIKINLLNLGGCEKFQEEINPAILQRQIGYSRICRKVKQLFKQKQEGDLFADNHLSDALVGSKFNN